MFAWNCAEAGGTHLGTCVDRFYFGSCCKLPEIIRPDELHIMDQPNSIQSEPDSPFASATLTTKRTTTTTKTTTTTAKTTTTATTTTATTKTTIATTKTTTTTTTTTQETTTASIKITTAETQPTAALMSTDEQEAVSLKPIADTPAPISITASVALDTFGSTTAEMLPTTTEKEQQKVTNEPEAIAAPAVMPSEITEKPKEPEAAFADVLVTSQAVELPVKSTEPTTTSTTTSTTTTMSTSTTSVSDETVEETSDTVKDDDNIVVLTEDQNSEAIWEGQAELEEVQTVLNNMSHLDGKKRLFKSFLKYLFSSKIALDFKS